MCFLKEDETDQAARYIKSRILTKVIYYVLSIDTFEQQYVVLKVMLKSPRLKDHVQTIAMDQFLGKNAKYEHKCLENIKNYTNKLVSVTASNHLKMLLRMIWFLLLKYS